ncbi:TonB-dependent receptor [Vibrio coralliilyticus]|uniref:TonB-dependent receptor domain-containing protein n=1 Tax=Vibrio TaxID=662 RepID=UPI000500CFF3|nr:MULTISPECIES: TonB-dependent receptor [Vibrio]KFI11539.1 membrane protein [Vibrio sp. B183]NOI21262.1 TonB-dependent receptor [Vibrio coralliilyticus]
MNRSILAIAVASLLPHASLSYAQEASADETMVVTASRFEQSEASVLASVTTITREEIDTLQAKSLTEVFKYVPGVQLGESGDSFHSTSIFIRGSESKHSLILLNGVKVNSASQGGFDLSLLPVEIIERIEIIRGPRAAVYGADAIGGVINFITHQAGDSLHQIKTSMGSDSYYQTSWQSRGQINEKTYGTFFVNYKETDGYNIKEGTSKDIGGEYGGESKDFTASLFHELSSKVQLNLDVFYSDSLSEFNGSNSSFATTLNERDAEFFQVSGGALYSNNAMSSRLSFSKSIQESTSYPVSEREHVSTYKTNRTSLNWLNSFFVEDGFKVNAGLDVVNEDVSSGTVDYVKKDRTNTGVFITSTKELGQFTLDGSVRFDDDTSFDNFTTWSAAIAYDFNEKLRVYGSYGTAFKAPSFYDLYDPTSGNPNLKVEESASSEIGLIGQFELIDWRLSAYVSKLEDMIIYYEHLNWAPTNTDADISGIEFEGSFDTGPIYHTVGLAYMDPEDSEGKQLARRAKETASWIGTFTQDSWDLSLSMVYQGDRYDDYSNNNKLEAYSLWNLSTNYYVTSNITLSGKVNNLLDEDYQTAKEYLTPERSYYLSASYQF